MFHHLASVADGVARLHAICGQFLLLETLCMPDSIEDDRLRDALELKDLPADSPYEVGVAEHKGPYQTLATVSPGVACSLRSSNPRTVPRVMWFLIARKHSTVDS